jgi:hypothetical protein
MLEDVCELPITFFEERHQCFRHVQLASCSYQEMQHLLNQAAMQNWSSFVIVSHGFELLNQAKNRPNPFIVKRFENLCRFLADNRDRFRTRTFAGLEAAELLGNDNALPLQSSLIRTAWRYGEPEPRAADPEDADHEADEGEDHQHPHLQLGLVVASQSRVSHALGLTCVVRSPGSSDGLRLEFRVQEVLHHGVV